MNKLRMMKCSVGREKSSLPLLLVRTQMIFRSPPLTAASIYFSDIKWPKEEKHLQVFVSAVEHPGHFWVQIIKENSLQFETLSQEMNTFYESGSEVVCQKPEVGDMVAVTFSTDPGWYRARVLEVTEDKVDVYYVDFGDSELVPKEKVMRLR
jgi:tudor domain-containing protein 2